MDRKKIYIYLVNLIKLDLMKDTSLQISTN